MIHACYFDFWETIIRSRPEQMAQIRLLRAERVNNVIQEWKSPYNSELAFEDINEMWKAVRKMRSGKLLVDIGGKGHARMLIAQLSLKEDPILLEKIQEALSDVPIWDYIELVPGIFDLIKTIGGSGIRVGLISNTGLTSGKILTKTLEKVGLRDFFHSLTFSDTCGVLKPHPKIFYEALGKQQKPYEAVFLGDNPIADVVGARLVGMKAILYRPPNSPLSFHFVDQETNPDAIISSMDEVIEAIMNFEEF